MAGRMGHKPCCQQNLGTLTQCPPVTWAMCELQWLRRAVSLGLRTEPRGKCSCGLVSFQVEICTGAMFMGLVLGLDAYQATMVLMTITGVYMITGEVALSTQVLTLTPKLYLLVESWQTLGLGASAFAFSYIRRALAEAWRLRRTGNKGGKSAKLEPYPEKGVLGGGGLAQHAARCKNGTPGREGGGGSNLGPSCSPGTWSGRPTGTSMEAVLSSRSRLGCESEDVFPSHGADLGRWEVSLADHQSSGENRGWERNALSQHPPWAVRWGLPSQGLSADMFGCHHGECCWHPAGRGQGMLTVASKLRC